MRNCSSARRAACGLTAVGRALLTKAVIALDAVADARAAVRAVAEGQSGRLTIGAVHSLLALLNLPIVLATFHHSFPLIEVRLMQGGASHLLAKLRRGIIDFALLPAFEQREDIRTRILACEDLVAVSTPDFHWPSDGAVRLEDLSGQGFMDFEKDIGSRRRSDQAFKRALVKRRAHHSLCAIAGGAVL